MTINKCLITCIIANVYSSDSFPSTQAINTNAISMLQITSPVVIHNLMQLIARSYVKYNLCHLHVNIRI